ncbi:methyl-accepting chemotaxis protein [Azospirillum thermophilum]|uniref:Methyl-accepting chemotaxis protein n=1 Tax=Azospirillum thermophilum TaxID=2202148 RepID=A0A2S2CZK6_9PROT|nr:methyl-accepting chemotaxis protein [Azospirillum thermophilum]AWK89941.1 methyl-accepting chemotaxis protein [Azospirillum thermophilum]
MPTTLPTRPDPLSSLWETGLPQFAAAFGAAVPDAVDAAIACTGAGGAERDALAGFRTDIVACWRDLLQGAPAAALAVRFDGISAGLAAKGVGGERLRALDWLIAAELASRVPGWVRLRPSRAAAGIRALLARVAELRSTASASDAAGAASGAAGAPPVFAAELMDRTVDVAIAINDASVANAQMASQLHEVDCDAQSIAAATEETVTGVSEIAERTRDVVALSRETNGATARGRETVQAALGRMDAIAEAVAQAARRVGELASASERIAEIVDTIETIAKQTNLLALNATIEAARAGEAGKGFAVVASEVKTLSNQTAKATEDIRTRIDSLKHEMVTIIGAMDDGTRAVSAGQEAMREVTDHMAEVAHAIDATTQRMAEISSILTQQTAAANDVSAGVVRIADRSAVNSRAILRSVEATKSVEGLLASQLKQLMEQDIQHKILKIAKVDHVIWKKRLADMVAGLETLNSADLASHEACRLGKWYYGPGSLQYRQHSAFAALEEPHRRVHAHGKAAVDAFNTGRTEQAMEEIARVEDASKEVLRLLDALQKPAGSPGVFTGGTQAAF